jgi:hypothetical protein
MNFLTKKVGPLPVWAYGAIVAGGGALFMSSSHPRVKGQGGPGGQALPDYSFNPLLAQTPDQNNGPDQIPFSTAVYGQLDSEIDNSFFGDGPLSLWTAGPMDYSDTFGGWRGRRRHGHHHRRHHHEGVGDDFPVGAGGFGYHHWHGPGFPPAPPGGEGFDNGGQNVVGFGGHGGMSGGNPWPQQTTMIAQSGQYLVQHGDTLRSVAQKFWGKGADFTPLAQANANLGIGNGNSHLGAGLVLAVPGASHSGPPAPGGPAGNGVGGGSIGYSGQNNGIGEAPPGAQGMPDAGQQASGGGSPSQGYSHSNSSRTKSGNVARNYAGSIPNSKGTQTPKAPSKSSGKRGRR